MGLRLGGSAGEGRMGLALREPGKEKAECSTPAFGHELWRQTQAPSLTQD